MESVTTVSNESELHIVQMEIQICYYFLQCTKKHDFWVPKVLFAYFFLKCTTFTQYHLSSYEYVDLTEDKWVVVKLEKIYKDKPYCPIIPEFSTKDWRTFKNQTRYESFFPEDNDRVKDEGVIKFRQKLAEKDFQHQSAWSSPSCNPVHNVTVLVPYRNRLHQLKKFIVHIHPFLKLQQVSYRIVIVEQMNRKFNRAKLFNVGFVESEKRFPSHCYIFHDVDQLPENLENIYGCTQSPRLMSAAMNSWRYLLSYDEFLGGVVSMTAKQFREINGFSNSYFGWGGEDDDFHKRVVNHNMTVTRFGPIISSYLMTPHMKELSGNNEQIYFVAEERFAFDGLNDLNYTLVSFQDGVGFTYIQVNV